MNVNMFWGMLISTLHNLVLSSLYYMSEAYIFPSEPQI